jgi:hypothetical protein
MMQNGSGPRLIKLAALTHQFCQNDAAAVTAIADQPQTSGLVSVRLLLKVGDVLGQQAVEQQNLANVSEVKQRILNANFKIQDLLYSM